MSSEEIITQKIVYNNPFEILWNELWIGWDNFVSQSSVMLINLSDIV